MFARVSKERSAFIFRLKENLVHGTLHSISFFHFVANEGYLWGRLRQDSGRSQHISTTDWAWREGMWGNRITAPVIIKVGTR
jgi:hypothetical protein